MIQRLEVSHASLWEDIIGQLEIYLLRKHLNLSSESRRYFVSHAFDFLFISAVYIFCFVVYDFMMRHLYFFC